MEQILRDRSGFPTGPKGRIDRALRISQQTPVMRAKTITTVWNLRESIEYF
jgi:hypothetical protein